MVDDGSSDETAQLAAAAGARLLPGPNRGPGPARNVGARSARGDVLIFLDADTAPACGWLPEMLAPFDDRDVVAVKGSYDTEQRGLIARFTQLEFEEKYDRLERAERIDFVDTGTAAYRRNAFVDAGGFDESFLGEDVELAFRLASRGARLVFNRKAVVLHQHSESVFTYARRKMRYGFARAAVYRRYPNKAVADSYTPRTMPVQIASVGLLLLGLLGSAAGLRATRVVAAGSALVFGASVYPLTRRAAERDPALALTVPLLIFVRAFAQGVGIVLGAGELALSAVGLGTGRHP